LEVREAAEHCLVRAQLAGIPAADSFTHGVRKNTVCVGDSGDDSRDDVILELENRFRAKGTIGGLGPEMGAGTRVDELHRDAQLASCLAKAALHHVARAEFLAGGTYVDRLTGVAQRGAARDDPE